MIALLDGGGDTSRSFLKAASRLDADLTPVQCAGDLDRADKIVLADGGDFAGRVRALRERGLVRPLLAAVADGRPVLGVSLGFQLLLDVCYDAGQHTGLGVIPGKVTRFHLGKHPAARTLSKSHAGWNQVHWTGGCPLMRALQSGESFYFDHALYAEPLDANVIVGHAEHGIDFPAVAWRPPVFGVQFLPERSEDAGRRLLQNFLAM